MAKSCNTGRHELRRCVFVEKNVISRLSSIIDSWWDHIDEICVQTYMDALGYGINRQWRDK